jgi:hypothetical protein
MMQDRNSKVKNQNSKIVHAGIAGGAKALSFYFNHLSVPRCFAVTFSRKACEGAEALRFHLIIYAFSSSLR